MYPCGVGLGPLKAVQSRESTSLCHVLIWPWHSEVDSRRWTIFNGLTPTPHRYTPCTCDRIYSFNVLLMMGAESTRNMYSNFAVNNKDDCLKLRHGGYLTNKRNILSFSIDFVRNISHSYKHVRNQCSWCVQILMQICTAVAFVNLGYNENLNYTKIFPSNFAVPKIN
jgi:hypothetical protein